MRFKKIYHKKFGNIKNVFYLCIIINHQKFIKWKKFVGDVEIQRTFQCSEHDPKDSS